MSSYARSLRRALSLRRPAPAPAVELPAVEEADPKLRALEATDPQLLDPKLAPERDDEGPRSIQASEVPLEERWTFDNPPPWHRQFTVRSGGLGGRLVCNLCIIVMSRFGSAAPPFCFRTAQSCSKQHGALAGARHGGGGGRLCGAEFHHHQGAFRVLASTFCSSEVMFALCVLLTTLADLLRWTRPAAGADDGHHAVTVDGHVADRVRPAEGVHRAAHAAGLAPCAVHAAGVHFCALAASNMAGLTPCTMRR